MAEQKSLSLIVVYKLGKGVVELLLGTTLIALAFAGVAGDLREVAISLRYHAVEAWSIALAEQLVHASTQRHIDVLAIAAFVDGALCFIEGLALHRRTWWSRGFILWATACLIPFEIVALLHRFSAGRVALLTLNVVIVLYLMRRRVVSSLGR